MDAGTIGKYEIVEVLGQGGMGTVYKARDPRIGRLVAIKRITAGFVPGSELLRRFLQEAEAVGKLQHPNIVTVYDLGDEGGTPYLVMEYVVGDSLDKVIAARRELTLIQKLDIIIQVCNALHYAHQQNIIHRDVKPANVILLPNGHVKLLDFGVAHVADKAMTRTGQIIGTLNYISPEQLNGHAVDARSDVFSVGVMLYQLLTYALPFDAQGTAALITKILHDPVPPLTNFLHDVPGELDGILERALAKNPNHRYTTAEDLAFDLAHAQEELKRDLVEGHLEEARALVARAELPAARDVLARVLKVDTQHALARHMMYEVQRLIERKQSAERIQVLKTAAEQALTEKRYADALASLDEALQLDKTDTDLLSLRDLVQQKIDQQQQIQKLLRLAEGAQQAGELVMAKNAVEDALQIDPNDTRANVLHASLVRQIGDVNKRKRIRDLLNTAHQEISAKNFTAAYELIQQAEGLDGADADVQTLKGVIASGQKQEARRREVESACAAIEALLSGGDVKGACTTAAQMAKKFPGEPALIQLKAVAENKRDTEEKNHAIDNSIAETNRLLENASAKEALKLIQRACQRFAGDSRLQSMLDIVRERVQQENDQRLKQSCLEKANQEINNGEYEAALATLNAAQTQLPGDIDIADLMQNVRSRLVQAERERKVEVACKRGQQLMTDGEYRRAVTLLERAEAELGDSKISELLQQARAGSDKLQQEVGVALEQAQRMLQEGRTQETVTFLLTQPSSYSRVSAFTEMCDLARREFERSAASQTVGGFAYIPPEVIAGQPKPALKQPAQPAPATEPEPAMAESEPTTARMDTFSFASGLPALTGPAVESDAPVVSPNVPSLTSVGNAAAAGAAPAEDTSAPAAVPIVKSRARPFLYVAALVALVIVVSVIGLIARRRTPAQPATAPPAPTGYVEMIAQPWGTVKNFIDKDGKSIDVGETTPVRVQLPAGEYTVTVVGPNNEEQTDHIVVTGGQSVQYQHTFEAVDAKKIVTSY